MAANQQMRIWHVCGSKASKSKNVDLIMDWLLVYHIYNIINPFLFET